MRLIDKDILEAAVEGAIEIMRRHGMDFSCAGAGVALAIIKGAPVVDAVPVAHAYWNHCNGKSHIWYCSNCGEKVNYNNAHKVYTKAMKSIEEVNRYCRGCGAKMDGERRDKDGEDS